MFVRTLMNGTSFDALAHEMDRLFDRLTSWQQDMAAPVFAPSQAYPALNVWEDESKIYVEAEVPGLSIDQVDISATAEELTIRGAHRFEIPEDGTALRRERPVGEFSRTISLPTPVNVDSVEATLRDGVLMISLPKAEPYQTRRIEVKALPAS